MLSKTIKQATESFPWLLFPRILRNQGLGLESVRRFQSDRLRQVIERAFRSPHYHESFNSVGLLPGEFRGLEDLRDLPAQAKKILRGEHALRLLTQPKEGLILHCTSGSTGSPSQVFRNWHEERLLGLLRLKTLWHYGQRLRSRRAVVSSLFYGQSRNLPHQLLQKLGLLQTRRFNCFDTAPSLLKQLVDFSPDVVSGYPNTLVEIARELQKIDAPLLRPMFVTSGGETLTPLARTQIREAFSQAPVYNLLGATEFNLVASECPETGLYHVADGSVVAEVLGEDGAPVEVGKRGNLVGTSLHSFAQPLIRLPLGDMVVKGPSPCPCGAACSTFIEICGRNLDYLDMPNNQRLHPFEFLDLLLRESPNWLRRFRLVQETLYDLVLEYVGVNVPEDGERKIQRILSAQAPSGVNVSLRRVEHLEVAASGKFQMVASHLEGTE